MSTWQGPQVGEVYTTSRGLPLSWYSLRRAKLPFCQRAWGSKLVSSLTAVRCTSPTVAGSTGSWLTVTARPWWVSHRSAARAAWQPLPAAPAALARIVRELAVLRGSGAQAAYHFKSPGPEPAAQHVGAVGELLLLEHVENTSPGFMRTVFDRAVADELRRQADEFIDLLHLAAKVGRDPNERAPRERRPAGNDEMLDT